MNQSILFNDDHHYDIIKQAWVFTGILSGEHIKIHITSKSQRSPIITNELKFDWEMLVEDWLEDNEPMLGIIHIQIN